MADEVLEEHEGRWRRAVPLPFYSLLYVRCGECGKRFWPGFVARERLRPPRYERHYRQAHLPPEKP